MAGDKQMWRLVTRLIADSSVLVAASSTTDIHVDHDDSTSESTGHAFYVLNAYSKDGVKVFPFGQVSPGIVNAQASVGYYREFSAGPPPVWDTFLRFTNLALTPITISYKFYRWMGLT